MKSGLTATAILVVVSIATGLPPANAQSDLSKVFDEINPSVLTVSVFDGNGRQISHGSGFVVDQKGIIATSLHVVQGAKVIRLTSIDDEEFAVDGILRLDQEWDVALLKTGRLPLKALALAPAGTARVGMDVIAIGSPLGFSNTISQGIVSGLRKPRQNSEYDDLLQITSAVSPGSSGGPVLTVDGQVIGIATATTRGAQNLNFAVPSRVVQELMDEADPDELEVTLLHMDDLRPLRAKVEEECTAEDVTMYEDVILQAIKIGAPAYNAGNHLACFRLYEGASYKILYSLEERCPTAHGTLSMALNEATEASDPTPYSTLPEAQAWIIRRAFDSLLPIRQQRGPLDSVQPEVED